MKKLLLLTIVLLFAGCPATWKNACKIYFQRREYERAKEQALIGTEQEPGNYEAYALLGKAESALGNWVAGTKAFQKAFEIDSVSTIKWLRGDKENITFYWQTFYNAAVSQALEKNYDEALTNLKYSKLIEPTNTSQYILIGNIYAEKGDKDAAVQSYRQALSVDQENAEANFFIGGVMFEKKLYDSSLTYYDKAVAYFEKDYNQLKNLLFQNIKFDQALAQHIIELWTQKKNEELDQLIKVRLGLDGGLASQSRNVEKFFKLTAGLSRSYYFRGMCYYQLKADSLALMNLGLALNFSPNDLDALFFIGELLLRQKKWDEARTYFEKLTAIKEDDFAGWFYIGVCYTQTGDYKKAIEVYEEKVLPLDYKNIDVWNNLAYAYRESGNTKKALECLKKADQLQKEKK